MKETTESEITSSQQYRSVERADFEISTNTSAMSGDHSYAKRILIGSNKENAIEIDYNPAKEKKRVANLEFNRGRFLYNTFNK